MKMISPIFETKLQDYFIKALHRYHFNNYKSLKKAVKSCRIRQLTL